MLPSTVYCPYKKTFYDTNRITSMRAQMRDIFP
jgi:hypothetical protein